MFWGKPVGRLSADKRPTVGQQSVDRRPTVGRQVFWGALLHNYPLLFSPLSKTVNNHEEKNSHVKSWVQNVCKWKDYHLRERVWIVFCSHNVKIWLTFVRNVDDTWTFEIQYMHAGAHHMEPLSPIYPRVNLCPYLSIFRTVFTPG